MPTDVWKRFEEWRKNGTLTDDMKLWVRDYMTQNANGDYVKKPLPDTDNDNDLSDADARKLFIAFQNAFAGMAGDLDSFKDKDPQSADFVNQYFGANKLFKTSPAKQECADGIEKILQLLNQHKNLQDYIVENTKKNDGKPVFESVDKLQDLLKKCQRGPNGQQYNTDNSVQKKIQQVAQTLSGVVDWYSSIPQESPEYQAIYAIKGDLDNVISKDAFAADPRNIPHDKLKNFREIYAKQDKTGLLQTLYFNRNIRDRFAKYDNGDITKPIEKAEESVNWQDKDKDNYVDPKMSDVLTPLQQLQKWVGDTYSDTVKKYEELRGGTIFRRKEAKEIFSAIDKVKVKPADGLDGLLKKKSDIEGKLNNPVARQHFKWFVETMEPIAAKMPKAVAGAWKNATQMKAVIEQIILKATDPNNSDPHAIEKAETAMEVMTAMKYGLLTSKVMDAMKKTEFSIFSDGKLSWNKNEGIKFVTAAFDKSIKAAFLGVGYGVTVVRNKIMMSGMKFKNQDNQNKSELAKRFNEENTNKQQILRDQNAADQNGIDELTREQHTLNYYINNQANREANYRQLIQKQDAIMNPIKANHDAYQNGKNIVDNYENDSRREEYKKLYQKRHDLKTELTDLRNKLAGYRNKTDAVDIAEATSIQQQIARKQQMFDKYDKRLKEIVNDFRNPAYITQLRQAYRNVRNYQTDFDKYNKASKERDRLQNRLNDLTNSAQTRADRFNEATREIQELNDHINDRNTALNNWPQTNTNKVLYLENYWNWLQTGETKTWRLSTKNAQKTFDINNANDFLLQQHISQHSLAA